MAESRRPSESNRPKRNGPSEPNRVEGGAGARGIGDGPQVVAPGRPSNSVVTSTLVDVLEPNDERTSAEHHVTPGLRVHNAPDRDHPPTLLDFD